MNETAFDGLLDRIYSKSPTELSKSVTNASSTTHYPELILQKTEKATRLYSSFQSHEKQFIPSDPNSIVRWSGSSLQAHERGIIDLWSNLDRDTSISRVKSTSTPSNTLFSWSTSDVRRNGKKEKATEKRSTPKRADPLLKLHRIIEKESNRFIHDRIQVIKAHHRTQIAQQIHERKRKDHEVHLQKLREKEEEYEQALRAAMTDQNRVRQQGFFGSLFGFGYISASHNHQQIHQLNQQMNQQVEISAPSSPRTSSEINMNEKKSKRFLLFPGALWKKEKEKEEKEKDTKEDEKDDNEHEEEEGAKDKDDYKEDKEEEEDENEMKKEATSKASPPPIDLFAGLDEFENFQVSSPEPPRLNHNFLPVQDTTELIQLDS